MSLAKNTKFLRPSPKLQGLIETFGGRRGVRSPLVAKTGFGTNPGNLRMFSFAPESLQLSPALVVVLHGCGQNAAGYDLGAGWSTLAKHYRFALLMPEQQPSNNVNRCFNWFNPQDSKRGRGEASSIRQMITRMVRDHKIDKHRIFVTGLSAGGAMTSVMLASYPEVFAAGAIIAGLPYGVATNPREAAKRMFQSLARPASELGDLVRNASKHHGPWPKVSVWHGGADRTIDPANADEIVKHGSTCISCLRHQCRRAPSTGIRIRSGGMQIAKRSWNPIPSPTWPMGHHSEPLKTASGTVCRAHS